MTLYKAFFFFKLSLNSFFLQWGCSSPLSMLQNCGEKEMSSIAMRPPLRLLKATSKTTWRDKTGHQERKKEDEIQLSLKTGLFFFLFL